MTRINCIYPDELTDKHLLAEYRELPRVFRLARNAARRGETADDPRNPDQYCYGEGHVRFFYKRLQYLYKRQKAIIGECKKRGFNIQYTNPIGFLKLGIPESFYGDWHPSYEDMKLNKQRIEERLSGVTYG